MPPHPCQALQAIRKKHPEADDLDAPFLADDDMGMRAVEADEGAADDVGNQAPFNAASMLAVFRYPEKRLLGYRAAQNLLRHLIEWSPTPGVPIRMTSIQSLMERDFQAWGIMWGGPLSPGMLGTPPFTPWATIELHEPPLHSPSLHCTLLAHCTHFTALASNSFHYPPSLHGPPHCSTFLRLAP